MEFTIMGNAVASPVKVRGSSSGDEGGGKVEGERKYERVVEVSLEERIKNWLKNRDNLILLGVLVFALAIRLYYFFLTNHQTLWWDEAEYMSYSNFWAFGIPYELSLQRIPSFQLIAALLLKIGFGETFIKFSLVLIPSVVLVYAVYLLGKEMFSAKIGLIAAFLTSVSWTLLFWGARVQPDYLSMLFQVLSIFFMWKYWKSPKVKSMIWAGIFAGLGFHFKVSGLLVPMAFGLFIFFKDGFSAFKNKHYYYFVIAFLVVLLPYFIWSQITFGTATAFKQGYSAQVISSAPFAWAGNINLFYTLTEGVLFILFLAGVLLSLKFLLYFDVIMKHRRKIFDPNIFSILMLVLITGFYVFYIRASQDRWVFLWLPFIFFLIGNVLVFIFDNLKKYNKILALGVVLGLLAFGGYSQLSHADFLIRDKLPTYEPVKQAALWMKANSGPEDVILSMSRPQTTYYAEREVYHQWHELGKENLEEFLVERRPKYVTVSVFERHTDIWTSWVDENQDRLTPVQVYYADAEQQNPLLIIYEIGYEQ
jgi:4-amino-4-deoxy-L-arabinose transferase-like glycosyltransferase